MVGVAEAKRTTRSIPAFFRIGLIGLIALGAVVACRSDSTAPVYIGDGRMIAIGQPDSPGYSIEFDEFDLEDEFTRQFTILKVPDSRGREYLFALRINVGGIDTRYGNASDEIPVTSGMLSFRLTSSDDTVIFDVRAPISQWRVHSVPSTRTDPTTLELWSAGFETSVEPEQLRRKRSFTFDVTYEPGTTPIDGTAIPIIRVGGFH